MKKLLLLSFLIILLPLAYSRENCETSQNPDLCYFVNAQEASQKSLCSNIKDPSLRSQCESTLPDQMPSSGSSALRILITALVLIFVLGLILAFYWIWHKSHTQKSQRLRNLQYPQLLVYINKAKKAGKSKSQIRLELKKQGWPDSIIDQYL